MLVNYYLQVSSNLGVILYVVHWCLCTVLVAGEFFDDFSGNTDQKGNACQTDSYVTTSVVGPKSNQSFWPITKDTEKSANQSKLEIIACSPLTMMQLTQSAGKLVRARHDWFWFYS